MEVDVSKAITISQNDCGCEQKEDLARESEDAERERMLDELVRLTEEFGGYDAEEQ